MRSDGETGCLQGDSAYRSRILWTYRTCLATGEFLVYLPPSAPIDHANGRDQRTAVYLMRAP